MNHENTQRRRYEPRNDSENSGVGYSRHGWRPTEACEGTACTAPRTSQRLLDHDSIRVIDPHSTDCFTLAQDLLHTLSPEETELAAQSSYAYWVATFSDRPPTEQERTRMAFREARRYLSYKDKAEEYLKRACNHRKVERSRFESLANIRLLTASCFATGASR